MNTIDGRSRRPQLFHRRTLLLHLPHPLQEDCQNDGLRRRLRYIDRAVPKHACVQLEHLGKDETCHRLDPHFPAHGRGKDVVFCVSGPWRCKFLKCKPRFLPLPGQWRSIPPNVCRTRGDFGRHGTGTGTGRIRPRSAQTCPLWGQHVARHRPSWGRTRPLLHRLRPISIKCGAPTKLCRDRFSSNNLCPGLTETTRRRHQPRPIMARNRPNLARYRTRSARFRPNSARHRPQSTKRVTRHLPKVAPNRPPLARCPSNLDRPARAKLAKSDTKLANFGQDRPRNGRRCPGIDQV